MKKTQLQKAMSELSKQRWASKTAEERREAARRAGLGNAKLPKKERRARARKAAQSISKEAAAARARKAAETRRKNREAAEAEAGDPAAVVVDKPKAKRGRPRKAVQA